ncbi:Survival motor neuron [Nannochloropsis gaditana]|uniref:Survival motor neuron n=1 Tax=Nannochloropsis gaditana TaxID=72520 RepID=W7U4D0_9STRA|nr:Survival motor neuron [Nannochloropsis gaditana]
MYSSGMVFGNTNGHAGTTYHAEADSNTWDDSAIINAFDLAVSSHGQAGRHATERGEEEEGRGAEGGSQGGNGRGNRSRAHSCGLAGNKPGREAGGKGRG